MQWRIAITLHNLYVCWYGCVCLLTDVAIGSLMRNVQRMEQRTCENTDGTKQNSRKQEGRHEAEQEKTTSLGPQFCRSGVGILRKGEKEIKRGRHEAERGRHKVKLKKTGCAYGYPSVPILLVSATENSNG
ncbi:vacuolar protein sorting-associated protein 28 [Trichinella spiralis]|uniref:vacuolar protein sorting-associated protein 28 n=1 Tax=Trichinella spiralis TaxID=6334 RepID=UPI0001EFDF37|nr:vacuolar protein sorting-associated protein 28 [Trichinella spiralis]